MESNKEGVRKKRLKLASQAEILRSHQRDNDFTNYLMEKLVNLLPTVEINNFLCTYSNIPASLIYFTFTTAIGNQTLGEEYTGIVEANLSNHKVPGLSARIGSVLLECLGEKVLTGVLKNFRLSIEQQHSKPVPPIIFVLNNLLLTLQRTISILVLAHRGLFYIYGRYYSIGKRIAGIDYVKVYGMYARPNVSWGLKLLGIVIFIQCLIKICQRSYLEGGYNKYAAIQDGNDASPVCQLCLELNSSTATPCGHLFCWSCLCDWLCTKSQCPLCREYCAPSRIIHLMNL